MYEGEADMIIYKCKTCGAQMDLGDAGSFSCPYCGGKSFLTDADYRENKVFRKSLLEYYKAKNDSKEFDYSSDTLWKVEGRDSYEMANGKPLSLEYMIKKDCGDFVFYICKETVVYIFNDERQSKAFMDGLDRLQLPEADNKLKRCFPELKIYLQLAQQKRALVFVRRPGFYPASMFSPWPAVHLAWVISRMENFCCTLEYSGMGYDDISGDSVFINPATHEGALFGDWRKLSPTTEKSLKMLRRTATDLAENTREVKELYDFLNSAPAKDAFDDFTRWDTVIEKGFGGHKFVQM